MRSTLRYVLKFLIIVYLMLLTMLILPSFFGIQINTVVSGSMEPVIPAGAVIYVQPVEFKNIQERDIITFRLEKSRTQVTHRVVGKDEKKQCLFTKGDANKEPDVQPVSYENVQGIVRCTIPYLGKMAILLTNREGKIFMVGILLLLLGLEELETCGWKGMKK